MTERHPADVIRYVAQEGPRERGYDQLEVLDQLLPEKEIIPSKPAQQHNARAEVIQKSLGLNYPELADEEIEKALRKDSRLTAALGVFISIVEFITYLVDRDVRANFHESPLFMMLVLTAGPAALFVAAASARSKEAVRAKRRLLEAMESDRSGYQGWFCRAAVGFVLYTGVVVAANLLVCVCRSTALALRCATSHDVQRNRAFRNTNAE